MPANAPSGPPDKPDDRATFTAEIPPKVITAFFRTILWIFFLSIVLVVLLLGLDPTVLALFKPRV